VTPERIAGIIRAKRRVHPELRRPLRWHGLQRILARENVGLFVVPMPTDINAQLVPYLGSWSILINSARPPRRHTYYGAHELGHLWLHHDLHFDRCEQVYHMGYDWAEDPREDDAELFASMVLGRYL
jgi:Zn-dependent peptidase ImmA (M78 family)